MLKAYSYRLYPTPSQAELINKSFGCCRFIYNWALAEKLAYYQENSKTLSCFALMRILPKMKEDNDWLGEVPSQSLQQEISHLDASFQKFFKKTGGFPKFKSKHNSRKSFSCPQGCRLDFEKSRLTIPKCAAIKVKVSRVFEGKIKTVTISQSRGGRYFASVLVDDGKELPKKKVVTEKTSVGVDVGIKDFAILSTGEKITNPKSLRASGIKLSVLGKRLSRKQKGSNNRNKARLRVARLHEHIANQRKDFQHKLSSRLIRENQTVIVEDLAVGNMMKNHCLAKAISDCGWSQFKGFLAYKADWYGKNLIEIGRFEPSSKMCSCGVVNSQLKLSDREWTCGNCKTTHDRDVLAAQNIKQFGLIGYDKIQGRIDPVSLGSDSAVMERDEPRIPCL